jgi:two-component system, cell cycle sensor histidine kinase and response regulator CckA
MDGMDINWTDLDDFRQALAAGQEQLRIEKQKKELYRVALEHSSDGVVAVSGGNFVYANTKILQALGIKNINEILGEQITKFIHPDEQKRILNYHQQRTRKEAAPSRYESRVVLPDGQVCPVEISVSEIDIEGNKTFIVYLNDITQRRQAEAALRESESRYRRIFENTGTAMIIMEEDKRISLVNEEFEKLTDFSKQEVEGRMLWTDLVKKDHQERMISYHNLRRKQPGVTPKQYFFQIVTKSGQVKDILIRVDLIQATMQSVASLIDVSDRKKLEEQFLQAQKMESLGTLAGGIAHDFNNILMGIQGHVSLAMLKTDNADVRYEKLNGIEKLVLSGAELTRQLLGFARGGKYELLPTNLNKLITKVAQMFGRTKKEISIQWQLPDNLWSVEVDRGQIEQVLLNLFVNAGQAMPMGGNLSLETANIVLGQGHSMIYAVHPGNYVRLSVQDTGMGMDEATKQRAFDPFFTTKEKGRGTGLGLASTYGIIKNHGGYIDIESEPGKGAIFNIYLPASLKAPIADKESSAVATRGKETILVVDDEKIVAEVSKDMLEYLGYHVYLAGSGQEAQAVYMEKQGKIDLVILDMILPGISGSETYDRLKEINPEVKVLLSSGYSVEGQATQILERGCKGFIQKPVQMNVLAKKIREILDTM